MSILVTGGVGGVALEALKARGRDAVVPDAPGTGRAARSSRRPS